MDNINKNNPFAAWMDLYKAALMGVSTRLGWSAGEIAFEAKRIADEALKLSATEAERQQNEVGNG